MSFQGLRLVSMSETPILPGVIGREISMIEIVSTRSYIMVISINLWQIDPLLSKIKEQRLSEEEVFTAYLIGILPFGIFLFQEKISLAIILSELILFYKICYLYVKWKRGSTNREVRFLDFLFTTSVPIFLRSLLVGIGLGLMVALCEAILKEVIPEIHFSSSFYLSPVFKLIKASPVVGCALYEFIKHRKILAKYLENEV